MIGASRIRYDRVFVSVLLLTVALLFRVPAFLGDASFKRDALMQAVGFASLANVFVGLVVTWTGFLRRSRSAWFVMFIIVWVWAFPVLVSPLFRGTIVLTFTEWLADAWQQPGSGRIYVVNVILVFSIVFALMLPLKSFFWQREGTNDSASR